MKENSATIHVQVPVDVAAFLLNEKRGEVLKIENRHRISVILIPNKHLDTPHYKLERIKHDDPRLEDSQASYSLAESAETDMAYSKRQKEEAKPRQEAMVKTITPDQPAPLVERKPAETVKAAPVAVVAPASKGFWAKLMSVIMPEKEVAVRAPVAPTIVTKAAPAGDRGDRNARGPRGRSRNGKPGGRERDGEPGAARPAQDEAAKPADAAGRPARPPRPPREPREPRENQAVEGQAPRERGERPERPERTPRPPREPRGDKAVVTEAKTEELALSATAAAPVLSNGPAVDAAATILKPLNSTGPEGEENEAADGEEPRRRRRRGGRNRNRRDREAGEGVDGVEGAGSDEQGEQSAAPAVSFTVAPAHAEEAVAAHAAPVEAA